MKKTSIIAAAALIASFGLVGCGGGGGGGDTTASSTTTVEGTAVDPELVGATVCIDMNDNGECEVGEPYAQTDINGSYSFTVDTDDIVAGATLLVEGGYDRVTKMPFVGTMTAMIDEANLTAQMITPLTTLVYERAMAVPESMEAAQQEVSALFGIPYDKVQANMLTLSDNIALQASMAMQQAAELGADANDTRAFYRAMAEASWTQGNDNLTGLMTYVAEHNLSDTAKELQVKYFTMAMDTMDTAVNSELYAMGIEKMQETISVMSSTDIENEINSIMAQMTNISVFVDSMMITSPDEVETYVTEHLLQAAGVAQPIIDQVVQTIVDNADITVDTSFEMMITMMTSYEDEIKAVLEAMPMSEVDAQAKYDEMIAQVTAMRDAFEPAS